MKKYIYTLLTLSLAMGSTAQGKLDMGSRARLHRQQAPVEVQRNATGKPVAIKELRRSRADVDNQTVNAFVTPIKGADTARLEALCTSFRPSRTGDVILVSFPMSALEEIESLSCVAAIKTEQRIDRKMNLVRPLVGVDKIHAGEDLPQAYTGKGVICGIVDGGFDPNHVNFLDADGKSRVKQFTYFAPQSNTSQLRETRTYGDDILEIDTENDESFHATHTSGIMFGSYRGKINAGVKESDFKASVQEIDNPYYGVATGADIIMASAYEGQLSDYYIAMGIESMLDYAYEMKQPLSVNLSLGSNVGPHDGSSVVCRYVDAVCDYEDVNTIVSISAGNEGDAAIVLKHTFTKDGEEVGAGLRSIYNGQISGYQHPRAGLVYIYSDTDEPFEVQFHIINQGRIPNRVAFRYPLPASPEGASSYWASDADWIQDTSTDKLDVSFGKYFHGYVGLNAEIDPDNNRYYAVLDFTNWDNVETENGGLNAKGLYALGFSVVGKAGQKIEVYGDNGMCDFVKHNVYGLTHLEPTFDGTISDIATGNLPIIVGSYDVRDDWASLDKVIYGYQGTFKPGHMSSFTSFGTLMDGRVKPDICAPGATVISSANDYYWDAYIKAGYLTENSLLGQIQGRYDDDKRRYTWFQCLGTSMASPVVAGCMALWLEANPNLTTAEARKIIEETAIKDEFISTTGNPVQWGWGKFDAYAGLKKVIELKNAGIDNVLVDGDARYMVRGLGGNTYEVFGGEVASLDVKVYNMQGGLVLACTSNGNETTVDCSSLAQGVYVIAVNNAYSQKISVK